MLICVTEETLIKYSPCAGFAAGGGERLVQMQRKLNLRSNGCKECGFFKMSISKMVKKIKVFWIELELERVRAG